MSSKKYLKFGSKGKTAQALSNFADLQVVIDGKTYKTGEHAFYANKYFTSSELYKDDSKRKQKLLDYANKFVGEGPEFETPLDAKKGGSKTKFKLKDNEIEAWSNNSIKVQKEINDYKYNTYPEVREVLEKYSDRILLHQDNRAKPDTLWGARISKEDNSIIGKNLLGKLWEDTRKEMQVADVSKSPSPQPEPVELTSPSPQPEPVELTSPSPQPEPVELTSPSPQPEPVELTSPSPQPEPVELTSPSPQPEPVELNNPLSKPQLVIEDDVPVDESEVTHIELPKVKQDKQEKNKKISIYNKNLLKKSINLHISEIGSNLTQVIEQKTKNLYENICINDGFIKKDSIQLTTYSSGIVENSYVNFQVEFECMVFRPVEGMIIYNCLVDNISRAGIKARTNEDISPAIIFIAKDHAYNSEFYNSVKEDDKINIKVIGHRYELKDSKISIIASLIEKKNIKIVLKK